MPSLLRRSLLILAAMAPFAAPLPARAQPSAAEWSALAKLPDFSGVWVPDVADQRRKERKSAAAVDAGGEGTDRLPVRRGPRRDGQS